MPPSVEQVRGTRIQTYNILTIKQRHGYPRKARHAETDVENHNFYGRENSNKKYEVAKEKKSRNPGDFSGSSAGDVLRSNRKGGEL